MDANVPTTTVHPRGNTGMLALIAILLLLLVVGSGYRLYSETQRAAAYQQRVATVQKLMERRQTAAHQIITRRDQPQTDEAAQQTHQRRHANAWPDPFL